MPTPTLALSANALNSEIGSYYAIEELNNPPNPFADTADWEFAWPILLADAIEIVNNEHLLTDPDTGAPLELGITGEPNPPEEPPLTIELYDAHGTVLASHTYTEHMPPRPNRPAASGWKQAAADACHAMATLIADLNTDLAGSQ
ncbi:hypothetical protein [Nocardia carnea]|uniref:hypothetical protein n=1 Tax=Nocardia carnea TaxID=37328 RepID=UPI0002FAB1FA|nr:hypothetical protein [Nocardia carnea]